MHEFAIGDRVLVHGGYDGVASQWLAGGPGYRGTIVALNPNAAVIELDEELTLTGGEWQDFGLGAPEAITTVNEVTGRWLVLLHTWLGAKWVNPVEPVHVGVCHAMPDPDAIPDGGGAGVWVESHATVSLWVEPAATAEPGPVGAKPGFLRRILGRR